MNNWSKDALNHLLSMSTFFETEDDRININISGTHYEINVSDLQNFPMTLLGDPFERVRYLVPDENEYFFAHHSSSFESILYYYLNDGVLIKSELIPSIIFYEEIRFFQLNQQIIQRFYNEYLSINEEQTQKTNSKFKQYLSQLFIHPPSTLINSLFNTTSIIINALAIYSLCLETVNIYRNIHKTTWFITHSVKPINRTEGFQCSDISLRPYQYQPNVNSENITLEIICVTWFYIELFLRTFSASSFFDLLNDPNYFLDILSILPTILSQILFRINNSSENLFFDYLTCLKLIRLFRLNRHVKCLEILFKIFYIHFKDLIRLTILISFGIFYFGLIEFLFEQITPDNEIQNIGEALWHGFTVILTIGYSDITESQFLSYIIAIIAVWYGAISMAIILPSFNQSYSIFQKFRNHRYMIKWNFD